MSDVNSEPSESADPAKGDGLVDAVAVVVIVGCIIGIVLFWVTGQSV